jgi:hypothetical protein
LEDISSTIIRKRRKENGDLEEFMNADAAEYYRTLELPNVNEDNEETEDNQENKENEGSEEEKT